MNNPKKNSNMRSGHFSATLLIALLGLSISAMAQGDGARFYWKTLMGTNAVPVIGNSMGGNANPLDYSHMVVPGAEFHANMALAGYAKMLPWFKRSAMVSFLVPMGNIAGDVSLNGLDYTTTSRGFGDPMLQLGVNLIGPKPMMGLPDYLRYTPGFSVDIIGSLAIPIGVYDNTSPINLGQNRWYGRIGLPVVWQLGAWVPGKRTTLEFLPAVWMFTDNTDFMEGKTMSTKAMYQVEGHLTRDFMEHFWGAFNAIYYAGGAATLNGVEGEALNNFALGATLGFDVNENMQFNLSYMTTVNDSEPQDLQMDGFRVTLIYGWHPLMEGIKRMKGE
jgi:hypothetical protein